jgi:hypothetical protein
LIAKTIKVPALVRSRDNENLPRVN